MVVVKRTELPAMVVPEEVVEVPSLGGAVIVRGLSMKAKWRFNDEFAAVMLGAEKSGSPAAARDLAAAAMTFAMLEQTVFDGDGQRLYTRDEWEVFGTVHPEEFAALFSVAFKLTDLASVGRQLEVMRQRIPHGGPSTLAQKIMRGTFPSGVH